MNIQNIKPVHRDIRGDIAVLFDLASDSAIRSILIITSKSGTIRANHFHKKDRHYTYLLSGLFEYIEQEQDKPETKKRYIVKPGEMIVTEPMMIHVMKFLKQSVIIVLTTEDRSPNAYEQDTVRVKLI